jgi:hypothetical protein
LCSPPASRCSGAVTAPWHWRIVSECTSQLRLLGVAEDVVVLTAQRLSRVAVLHCLDILPMTRDVTCRRASRSSSPRCVRR